MVRFTALLLSVCFSGSLAFADVESRRAEALGKPIEKFQTMTGRTYRNVVFSKINAGGVSFKHSDGTARLRFADLTPDQRYYFGLDELTAQQVYKAEAAQREAYEKLVETRENERKILAEKEALARDEAEKIASAAEKIAAKIATDSAAKLAAESPPALKALPVSATQIPLYPTLQRTVGQSRRVRYYDSYQPNYGSFGGYGGYQNYSPYSYGTSYSYGSPYYPSNGYNNHSNCFFPSIIFR